MIAEIKLSKALNISARLNDSDLGFEEQDNNRDGHSEEHEADHRILQEEIFALERCLRTSYDHLTGNIRPSLTQVQGADDPLTPSFDAVGQVQFLGFFANDRRRVFIKTSESENDREIEHLEGIFLRQPFRFDSFLEEPVVC